MSIDTESALEKQSITLTWPSSLDQSHNFLHRHLGPTPSEEAEMLKTLGYQSRAELIDTAVPADIRRSGEMNLPEPQSEEETLSELRSLGRKNAAARSLLGLGYYASNLPSVIQRTVLENPGWYTQYTPYQAEIAQGRLEMLLNFQTMVSSLTGMEVANASLLDEGSAAAEAMTMALNQHGKGKRNRFFVDTKVHFPTLSVLRTRAVPLGVELVTGDAGDFEPDETFFGALFQYPGTEGSLPDLSDPVRAIREKGGAAIVATDLLALTLLRPPGEFGADIVIGNAQRFGIPLGYGGPHAAFFATQSKYQRKMPGRLVGVSRDAQGKPGYRLSLQTREQHIRRDRATSNICTAQVLLAILSAAYAQYHGPEGLKKIARRINWLTRSLRESLVTGGLKVSAEPVFDTLVIYCPDQEATNYIRRAAKKGFNLRPLPGQGLLIALDEKSTPAEIASLVDCILSDQELVPAAENYEFPAPHARESAILEHPHFHLYHTETEMLRYLRKLEGRDLALNQSMTPLGSCTMKLNAATEMQALSWPEFADLHPFAPVEQAAGYQELFKDLEKWLAEVCELPAVSLQPNAGSQGEFAGLLAIRGYHRDRGEEHRNICLIPVSAHGTNPASAVMCGFKVVPVKCDDAGNIDREDLKAKIEKHRDSLAALMITYPSTHGVFEEGIREICAEIHAVGGQVYLDGANMNAQMGVCSPGRIGADVCHLNLHKTFCIPHGGGGPGVGPIAAAEHLRPFLPGHPADPESATGPVCSGPRGSALILTISWAYIRMMGPQGLRDSTELSIVNANYLAHRLSEVYRILYRGNKGLVAHECIIDLRDWKKRAGIEVEDVAKRLIDYGFHAPTMSWPVAGTLMLEPTESENKAELDRYIEALLKIYREMEAIEKGQADASDNVLRNSPHTAEKVTASEWIHPYSREEAAYPGSWSRDRKFWPFVGRVDNVFGDRNVICTCPSPEEFSDE
ncbi:MAG: aminomethyl-transferring glycine dehydrogenase [Opitutales bacterium]|nr:aminomethyl-transferring glycine dehydrogenase [Opitutales bacterium]